MYSRLSFLTQVRIPSSSPRSNSEFRHNRIICTRAKYMQWILPVGTQVVTPIEIRAKNKDILFPAGAVGIIVKSPTDSSHPYRVRFPDGYEQIFAATSLPYENITNRVQLLEPARARNIRCTTTRFIDASSARGLTV